MSRWKFFRLAAVLPGALGQAGVLADAKSPGEAVERLFELTAMQQKIEESEDSIMALQLAQSPYLRAHQDIVHEFLERQIGWNSLREALTEMYLQEFSEQELNTMNAFYSSPTGQKVIKRLPLLVQQRNQLALKRLEINIGELQRESNASTE